MKIRRGERIVCPNGHLVGRVTVDVADGESVLAQALFISGAIIQGTQQGYACGWCGEAVALLVQGDRWQVWTARGWAS